MGISVSNYKELKNIGVPLYECYSPKQWEKIISETHIEPIYEFIHRRTKKRVKVFIKTKEVAQILTQWTTQKEEADENNNGK